MWKAPDRCACVQLSSPRQAAKLDEAGRAALRDDMIRIANEANRALDDTFVSDWDYLVVTAEKR